MKLAGVRKRRWLWLSVVSFGLLLSLIYIEMGVIYPQVKRYFDNTGSLMAQPLAARARTFLITSLELYSESANMGENREKVRHNLDLAYGLLNIELYRQQYPCTLAALEQIDVLDGLSRQPGIGYQIYSREAVPVLKCTDLIQAGQDRKRSALAEKMAENLDFHRKLLLAVTLMMATAGLGFWMLHMKQRRLIAAGKDEADRWIRHAMRDGLTGVLNRRAFDTDLAGFVERYRESGNLFSLLMCDIDFFKQYNDTFGHVEGDEALRNITAVLADILRDRDSLYRYGGEELAILLENTDIIQADRIGRRALEAVQGMHLAHPESESGYLTISIGGAAINEIGTSGGSLVELADKRLYQAKQTGRNRLVSAGTP